MMVPQVLGSIRQFAGGTLVDWCSSTSAGAPCSSPPTIGITVMRDGDQRSVSTPAGRRWCLWRSAVWCCRCPKAASRTGRPGRSASAAA